MSVRQAVRILQALVHDDGLALERRHGSRAVSAAQDLASLFKVRLGQGSPYVSLWADFEADPGGMAAQLTGAIEALVEADPALGRRLEGFVREWRPVTGTPGARRIPAGRKVLGKDKVLGTTVALEPDEDVGKGAYLYGNLKPSSVAPVSGAGRTIDGIEGIDHIEVVDIDPSRAALLFNDMCVAVETHPGIDSVLEKDLEAELEEVMTQVTKGNAADKDRLARRLQNIGRMHPDILQTLLDRLVDPEVGWARVPQETPDST
jgi:hypothetical protein